MCFPNLMPSVGWNQNAPTVLYEDNLGALELAHGDRYHPRTKHIRVRNHDIRHLVEDKQVGVVQFSTHGQGAKIFTKCPRSINFIQLRRMMMGQYKRMYRYATSDFRGYLRNSLQERASPA